MSFGAENRISEQETPSNGAANCCSSSSSTPSSELKLYQAFIFSVPILFTFILLFLFYWFYLRRRRADWSSLRMRITDPTPSTHDLSRCEMGVKKELREMLPIIVFKESFSVNDTQCSVCLGEYQAEDRLQQIPGCGHTFHMGCIDLWLTTHTTCPLCRQSLLAKPPPPPPPPLQQEEVETNSSTTDSSGEEQDPQTSQPPPSSDADQRDVDAQCGEVERHLNTLKS